MVFENGSCVVGMEDTVCRCVCGVWKTLCTCRCVCGVWKTLCVGYGRHCVWYVCVYIVKFYGWQLCGMYMYVV